MAWLVPARIGAARLRTWRPLFAAAFLLAAALAVTLAAQFLRPAQTDAELRELIVGTWGEAGGCDIDTVVFNADGTFLSGYIGYQVKGTYSIANGQLLGRHDPPQFGDAPGGLLPPDMIRFDGGRLVLSDPSRGDYGQGGGLIRCK